MIAFGLPSGGLVARGCGSGLVAWRLARMFRPWRRPVAGARAVGSWHPHGRARRLSRTKGKGRGWRLTLDGKPGVPRVSGNESFLAWMARASGPIGLVIAAMSFYLFALVVWMALRLDLDRHAAPLVRELHELLEQKKYSEAYHRLIADNSLLAQILTAGVRSPVGLPMAQRQWSWPMKTPPWRWNIARLTLPPWERWDR